MEVGEIFPTTQSELICFGNNLNPNPERAFYDTKGKIKEPLS